MRSIVSAGPLRPRSGPRITTFAAGSPLKPAKSIEDDPDELAEGHFPLLFKLGAAPIGTIRVDSLNNGNAALRLVAIDPARQGEGHGRILLREAEGFARDIGCRRAVVYATPEAAGFYAAAGYSEDEFDDNYFGGIVQMAKPLHYAGFTLDDP